MRRFLVLITAMALVVTACSAGGDATATSATADAGITIPDTPDATATTSEQGEVTTTASPGDTTTTSDRPLAPDFTLELGDGASYTLSAGAKPVYLVFWAEW